MVYDDVVQIVSGFQGKLIFGSWNWNLNDISKKQTKKPASLIHSELYSVGETSISYGILVSSLQNVPLWDGFTESINSEIHP